MNRIEQKFQTLKQANKTAFIGFLTAGDPSVEKTVELIHAMEKANTDIIEIGVPYSDPLADGPIIQAASTRSLMNGTTVDDCFKVVKEVRKTSQVPLVFLVYYNTVYIYGRERFIEESIKAGLDGYIIPDLPLEEQEEFVPLLIGTNLSLIPLVAPTSHGRIKEISKNGSGFVYCVSSLGVTGRTSDFHSNIETYMAEVKKQTDLPICIGFGIGSRGDIDRLSPFADGLIVGSKIVSFINETSGNAKKLEKFITEFTK